MTFFNSKRTGEIYMTHAFRRILSRECGISDETIQGMGSRGGEEVQTTTSEKEEMVVGGARQRSEGVWRR